MDNSAVNIYQNKSGLRPLLFWYTTTMSNVVIIGSTNPVKIAVVEAGFKKVFPDKNFVFVSHKAKSGVPDQPIGIEETKLGAYNRALSCKTEFGDAAYYVGLEGGIEIIENEYWVSAWMCVLNHMGQEGNGRTSAFMLPPPITELIKSGMELASATDVVFKDTNSGQKGGAVGFLTNDVVTRKDFYIDALIFALVPFIKSDLYFKLQNTSTSKSL